MRYEALPGTQVAGVFRGQVIGPLIFDEDGLFEAADDEAGVHEVLATSAAVNPLPDLPTPKPRKKD